MFDFVAEILKIIVDEKIHDARWQFYLHKVFDMTFEEYVRRCEAPKHEDQEMSHEEIGNVINTSKKMLEGLKP